MSLQWTLIQEAFNLRKMPFKSITFSLYDLHSIKTRAGALTNLPPGKVDAKADAAPVGATNRELRRPSTDSLEGFFYV